jgi:hypothetical protein
MEAYMQKVYLAARYDRRDELREHRKVLNSLNIYVTSRWLDEQEPLNSQMGQHSEEFYIETARVDLEDVDAADTIIFFSENPLEGFRRGGRHVEYGYALKGGKNIVVVGPRENVFHYGIGATHFDSFEDLRAIISSVGVE